MSAALKRIEETREALVGALAERDWETIVKLDPPVVPVSKTLSAKMRLMALSCAAILKSY